MLAMSSHHLPHMVIYVGSRPAAVNTAAAAQDHSFWASCILSAPLTPHRCTAQVRHSLSNVNQCLSNVRRHIWSGQGDRMEEFHSLVFL